MTATNVINSLKSLSKSADDKLLQFSNHEVKFKEWLQLIKDTAKKIAEDDDPEEYTKDWIDLPTCRDFILGETASSKRNSKAFEKRAHLHGKRRTNGKFSSRISSKKKFSIEAQSRKSVNRTDASMVNGNSSAQRTFNMTPKPMTPVQTSSSVLKSTSNMNTSESKRIKLDESVQRKSIRVLRKSCKVTVTPTGSIAGKTIERLALQKENKPSLLSKNLTASSVSKTVSQKLKLESKLKQINRITAADKMSIGVKKSDFGAQKLALSNNKKQIKVSKISTKVDLACASEKKKNIVSQPRSSPRLQGKHVPEQNAAKAATKSKAANKKVANIKSSLQKMNEKISLSIIKKKTEKMAEKDTHNPKSNPSVHKKTEKAVQKTKTVNPVIKKEEPSKMNTTYTSERSPADQVKKQIQENIKKEVHTPDTVVDKDKKASGSASNSKKPQSSTPAASTVTTYEISDIGSDSDDETESDSSKVIPAWAVGYLFKTALISAAHNPTDPKLVFGRCNKKPDLEEIFNVKNQKYKVRSSSAIWNSPGSFLAG